MAKNTAKRLLLTGIFALSGTFVLAACDSVTAVPANYETPIILKDGNAFEDDENKLGEIYDALVSNKNEKVVSALLEKIAEKEFGTYDELRNCFPLKDADGNPVMDVAAANAHIEKYKHEFIKDNDQTIADKKGASVESIRQARLAYFFEDLNDRINKVIFDEISSDSYRDTINKTEFLEEKYARAKRQDNYDIKGFDDAGAATIEFKKIFIDSKFNKDNVREYLTNFVDTYDDYITRKLIPDVYKDKLVEEYIIDNNYSALGRAYGRKINFVKIGYDAEDPNTPYRLANLFVDTYLAPESAKGNPVEYDELVSWMKGIKGVSTEDGKPVVDKLVPTTGLDAIYGDAIKLEAKCEKITITEEEQDEMFASALEYFGYNFPDKATDPTGYAEGIHNARDEFKFYEKTKLGSILKNYEKAVVGEFTRFASSDDVAQYDSFTNNGKQSKEQGLIQKLTDLALDDYSEDGWYVKNDADGSLSELTDEIKNRLFNIKVSNDFGKTAEEGWNNNDPENYFKEVQGHYYLTPASASDAKYNFILRDTSGNALFIVEILEAPSTSKLNKASEKSYLKEEGADAFKTEEVARQIAKILGTKDTYTTNAYTSYLKLYTFVYHDTSVYEYLKETYPDLFEDD